MDILGLIQANILTPIVLFFILGVVAARIKSDLRIPDAVSEFLPIYLLAAIGLHGGIEMRETGFEAMLVPMLVAIGLSLLFTMNHYHILRRLGGFNLFDSYALASTYGAVGAVTFSVGLSFLRNQGVTSEGYLAAILATLEPAAFILAIFMTNMAAAKQRKRRRPAGIEGGGAGGNTTDDLGVSGGRRQQAGMSHVLRESLTGKAIVILLGGIVIGYLIGKEGFAPIEVVFEGMFVGAIVIFLLEMGVIAGKRLDDVREVGAFLIAFSVAIPTLNGMIGVLVATALGLSVGGAVMFGLLLASASFIAAPAVLRNAIPQAKPSLYITSALGITFPYNIIALLPMMFVVSSAVHDVQGSIDLMGYLSGLFT